MEWLIQCVSQAVATIVVVCTVVNLWQPLLILTTVLIAVTLALHFITKRFESLLTGKEKVIFITGCDTGIGHDACIAASTRGMTVVAGCFNPNSDGARILASTPRTHVVQIDVTKEESVEAARSQVESICNGKGLWAVVNNAGFNRQAPVELMTMHSYHNVCDVMLFGTIRVTKAFLPLVRQAKGRIVTMSSDRGKLSPAYSSAYCISKHGIETFSECLREEMKPFGVSVGVIRPGHFGGATSILNSKAMETIVQNMENDLKSCPVEVQQVYGGLDIVDKMKSQMELSKGWSATSTTPIVRAIMHAILSSNPSDQYLIQGTTGPVDWGIVLGVLKPLMPRSLLSVIQSIVMNK